MSYSYFDEEDSDKTAQLVNLLRDGDYGSMFRGWMESCAKRGLEEDEALEELSSKLQDFVAGQYDMAYDILRDSSCDVALALFMDDGYIDYAGAAMELMADEYEDILASRSRRPKASASKAARPKAKAPARKPTVKAKAPSKRPTAKPKPKGVRR